jgi:Domain of unknown function (DUF4332)
MDEVGFNLYLRKMGKKPHVVSRLIRQVEKFDAFLLSAFNKSLEFSTSQDLGLYCDHLEKEEIGSSRKGIRGVALYYRFIGNKELAEAASILREKEIAIERKIFPLKDFRGVSEETLTALKTIGITEIDSILAAGASSALRKELADKTGLEVAIIVELVKLSDLARIPGVKSIRARLYHDAGIDTVEKMAAQDMEDVLCVTRNFIQRTGFPGIPPLPREIQSTIEAARKLPRVVLFD